MIAISSEHTLIDDLFFQKRISSSFFVALINDGF